MSTIIDELIVTLGLDPKAYNKGSKEVEASLNKSKEASRTSTRDMESQNKRAGESFSKLKNEAVGLFLTFAGANSVAGFVSHIIGADAATGKLATGLGMATKELSAWEQATASAGGKAEDADAAFNKLSNLYFRFRTGKVSGEEQAGLFGLGIFDPEKLGKGTDGLLALAEAADRFKAQGKIPEFRQRMLELGIPDGMITALEKGKDGFKALVDQKYRDTAITKSDAERSQELINSLENLVQTLQKGARTLYPFVEGLTQLLDKFTKSGIAGPIAIGVISGFGIAAGVALGPIGLLAAALGTLYAEFTHFDSSGWVKLWGLVKEGKYGEALSHLGGGIMALPGATADAIGNAGSGGGGAVASPSGGAGNPANGGGSNAAWFRAHGLSANEANGAAADLMSENAKGNLGMGENGAFGLAQWRGKRREQLFAFAGTKTPNLEQQRQFMLHELRTGYKSALKGNSAQEVAYNLIDHYEIPDKAGSHVESDRDKARADRFLGIGGRAGRANVRSASGGAPAAAGGSPVTIGTIVVHTASTDAPGLAKDLRGALAQRMSTLQANRGLE